ncbi:MAG: DUF3012 domain-containing protein [Amphritea sp.]
MLRVIKSSVMVITLGLAVFALQGCSPEVGSKEWCADLEEKPKGDWSANEAKDFAKNCIL